MGMEANINHYSSKLTLWSHRKAVGRKAIYIEDPTPVTISPDSLITTLHEEMNLVLV